MLLESGVIGGGLSHIVVYILQYSRGNQVKKPKPTFISYTHALRRNIANTRGWYILGTTVRAKNQI